MEYLFGTTGSRIYKVVFVGMTVVGSTMKLGLAWDLSDTFNGLMMIRTSSACWHCPVRLWPLRKTIWTAG